MFFGKGFKSDVLLAVREIIRERTEPLSACYNSMLSRVEKTEAVVNGATKLVTCEDCGCAVMEKDARNGKSEIRERIKAAPRGSMPDFEPYVHTPKLCKHCAGERTKKAFADSTSAVNGLTFAGTAAIDNSKIINACYPFPGNTVACEPNFPASAPAPDPTASGPAPAVLKTFDVFGFEPGGGKTELFATVEADSFYLEDYKIVFNGANGEMLGAFALWSFVVERGSNVIEENPQAQLATVGKPKAKRGRKPKAKAA